MALDAIQKAKRNKDAYFVKLTMKVRHGRKSESQKSQKGRKSGGVKLGFRERLATKFGNVEFCHLG